MFWADDVDYEPVFRLGNTFKESLRMMSEVEQLTARFPGLVCGSCGAPTCRALAEDIVRGNAQENDCIFRMRQRIQDIASQLSRLEGYVPGQESAPDRYSQ